MPTYKTPGVYVEEISLFPPSVAPVETAIPGFIGYTEIASKNGRDITLVPTPVDSLLEFETLFGGPPTTDVTVELNAQNEIEDIAQTQGYLLYKSLQLFYANGGGRCYIVSVGGYTDGTTVLLLDFQTGLSRLEKVDEVTLLVAPDANLLDVTTVGSTQLYTLQQAMLAQCAKLQDRFAVLDLKAPNLSLATPLDFDGTVTEFRNSIGINELKYGAAYAPHIVSSIPFAVPKRSISLEDSGGGTIEFSSLTVGDQALDQLRFELEGAVDAVDDLESAYDALVTTVAAETLEDELNILLGNYQTAVDAFTAGDPFTDLQPSIIAIYDFIAILLSTIAGVSNGAGVNPALPSRPAPFTPPSPVSNTSNDFLLRYDIEQLLGIGITPSQSVVANIDGLINLHIVSVAAVPGNNYFDTASVQLQTALVFLYPNDGDIDATDLVTTFDNIAVPPPVIPADTLEQADQAVDAARTTAVNIIRAFESSIVSAQSYEDTFDRGFENAFGFYKNLKTQIINEFNTLPPCGAIVGAYAKVDETRGVFKAPANVSLNAVIRPTEQISREEQENLNVDPTSGKSINAIRPFTGKGILIWGARTLAGNDNEWRYVPVRRFFIFAEESIKKATEAFVFEPNDRNTWVKVRALIENFLTNQWRSGALAGAKADDAFFVRVGLGETMTAQDILEGKMIVEIGMAVVRPAEFIILRFSHKMQES